MGAGDERERVRAVYDEMATEYASRIADELDGKPLDRALLDVFAQRIGQDALVVDAGCGPGHVTRYLHDRGMSVRGVDLSEAMVAEAARLNPQIAFSTADLTDFSGVPRNLAGVVAFYSLIHLPRERVTGALRMMREHLRADGLMFVAFHLGAEVVHIDEWWGHSVSLDFTFFELAEMCSYMTTAGFELDWVIERAPYIGAEHPTRRGYILGRNAVASG